MTEETKVVAGAGTLLPQRLTQFYSDCGGKAALVVLRSQDDFDDMVASHGIDDMLAAIGAIEILKDEPRCLCAICSNEMATENCAAVVAIPIAVGTAQSVALALCDDCAIISNAEIITAFLQLWPSKAIMHAVACA